MKRGVFTVVGVLCTLLATAQKVQLTVENSSSVQRQEVVEFNAAEVRSRLAGDTDQPFVIKNALGQQVDYQLTHDGKLLVDVSVRPHSQAVLTVAQGFPQPVRVQVAGAEYPYRKNDLAWENDRIGFRVYGPQFQRDGDTGNGIDVWVKNTPDLILPDLYRDNCFRGITFHQDHGVGLDCYGVGPSLGCGAPALMLGDSLVFAYCYEHYDILDNGPLRFTVRLDFAPRTIGESKQVAEHRLITMDKGSHFCQIKVWYDGLKRPYDVAAGLVLHSADGTETGSGWMAYADPTQEPDKHQFEIYVAALFPSGDTDIFAQYQTETKAGIYGHLLGVKRSLKDGEPFTYYIGAAWSKTDIKNFGLWKHHVTDELETLRQPLVGVTK